MIANTNLTAVLMPVTYCCGEYGLLTDKLN